MFRKNKKDAVFKLIQNHDLEGLQRYFAENKFEINAISARKVTLLHWAVLKTRPHTTEKMLPIIQFLLEKGADQSIPESGSNAGYPLISATRRGLPEVVEMLLDDEKVYVNCADATDKTALDYVNKILDSTVLDGDAVDTRMRMESIRNKLDRLVMKTPLGKKCY